MISVLFTRRNSIYKKLGLDCWDEERNALNWPGGNPVIAHPPCRLWGRLYKLSKAPESEKSLALFAVSCVRKYGGVLEHPAWSKLWNTAKLPVPGAGNDIFGGYSISVPQKWWGHKAEKDTWLYIVGLDGRSLPEIPYTLNEATHVCCGSKKKGRPELSVAAREATPPAFAAWLIEIASNCKPS